MRSEPRYTPSGMLEMKARMWRSDWSFSASMEPKHGERRRSGRTARAHRSWPVRSDATWARKSLSSTSGIRTLLMIQSTVAATSWPARCQYTGGIRRPSANTSRAPDGTLPGAMPPMSRWCARVTM